MRTAERLFHPQRLSEPSQYLYTSIDGVFMYGIRKQQYQYLQTGEVRCYFTLCSVCTCMYLASQLESIHVVAALDVIIHVLYVQGSQQQAGTLRHRFDDVRPTLLLFLQRLQCIIVNDVTADETSIMVR